MNKRIRINKYLSQCGLGARRKVEEYVISNRVTVNGEPVRSLATLVDVDSDIVKFDNKELRLIDDLYYLMLNKPRGVITSVKDELNRQTVMDLIPAKYRSAGVVPVGRLDKDSEGLLLLTNDGETAYRLTHPGFQVKKEYIVKLDKSLEERDKLQIERGVVLYGNRTNQARIFIIDSGKNIIKISISEGKKRQIRLMFDRFSYKVLTRKRTTLGPLRLGKLPSGSFRLLKKDEIKKLK
jgi:pseudouridine synthase